MVTFYCRAAQNRTEQVNQFWFQIEVILTPFLNISPNGVNFLRVLPNLCLMWTTWGIITTGLGFFGGAQSDALVVIPSTQR